MGFKQLLEFDCDTDIENIVNHYLYKKDYLDNWNDIMQFFFRVHEEGIAKNEFFYISKKNLKILENSKLDVNYIDKYGNNFLMFFMSIMDSHHRIHRKTFCINDEGLEYLLDKSNIYLQNNFKSNLLFYISSVFSSGSKNSYAKLIVSKFTNKKLLQKLLNQFDNKGISPINKAIECYNEDLIKLFLLQGAKGYNSMILSSFMFSSLDYKSNPSGARIKLFNEALLKGDLTKNTTSQKSGDLLSTWATCMSVSNKHCAHNIEYVLDKIIVREINFSHPQKLKKILSFVKSEFINNKNLLLDAHSKVFLNKIESSIITIEKEHLEEKLPVNKSVLAIQMKI